MADLKTKSHRKIRQWVEQRGGRPAVVKGTGRAGRDVLRIDFPGYRGLLSPHRVSWDEFFERFDAEKLTFVYQETTANGRPSRFCKLIRRSRKPAGR